MIKNQIKTVLLLAALTGLLLGIGQLIGGRQGLFIGLIFAIGLNFFSYWYSDKIVLAMYRAQPVKKSDNLELYNLVRDTSKEADLPMPKLYIIPTDSPNAFATGRNPNHSAVAVTEGILSMLNKEELKGVIAHELAHIKNRDTLIQTIAATIAGVISYIAYMARFAALFGGSRNRDSGGVFELLALSILTPIIATILQLAISRSREYLADERGARTIRNPKALASALHKLEIGARHRPLRFGNPSTSSLFIINPFSSRGLFMLFSTHPPLEKRIERLNSLKI